MNGVKNRIESLRKKVGLSQQELAEKIGVHQTAISQWEQGHTKPGFDALIALGHVFDVNPMHLCLDPDKEKEGCEGCIAISRGVVETWRCHACIRNPDLRDRYEPMGAKQ